ncbi:L,D-transpeptidase family protein [Micromonospora sp. NBC_01699]|uniref:L,D-transpeptidase family protein n=1 Tax=Micromonospora sp. NBC_01699 TaxID=2975984 RepID=UPI002E2E1A24|nr:L,D-transpeptidase family protein [Micromonospora sp. NBC_01699]
MPFVPSEPPAPSRTRARLLISGGLLALLGGLVALTLVITSGAGPDRVGPPPVAPNRMPTPIATGPANTAPETVEPSITAIPPPDNLPVVDYDAAPGGFPADPDPLSTVRLREGLRPTARVGAYDAPGGRPRAFLEPNLAGVTLVMPIVQRRSGWAAVLLPSANRTLAWVPPGDWTTVPLRDQLVVERKTYRLTWLRDDQPAQSWRTTLGTRATPTPLGRTFVLGRSTLTGRVYADTDVFALGAIPDDPDAVPTALRGAHIGLHTWYNDDDLGTNVTDGCIRITRSGQRKLLDEIGPGTMLVVVDKLPAATPGPLTGG